MRVLLRGGRVLRGARFEAADVLLEGDRVAAVGPRLTEGYDGGVVDVSGRLVTPAFVDAHVHLAATGFARLGADLSQARSVEEALGLLHAQARSTTLPVVLAHGWDETRWPEGRPFTRSELDEAVGDRPAYVARVDVHSAVVSTALLPALDAPAQAAPAAHRAFAGWSDEGPLTAEAHHAARGAVAALLDREDRRAAIAAALCAAAARGVGAVHEMAAPHINPPGDFDLIRDLVEDGASGRSAAVPAVEWYWGELGGGQAGRLGCRGAAGDLCVDGAIGSRTAALEQPYADAPSRGNLYLSADQVADHVVRCTEAGLQAGFHVIGDRAVATAVAGFKQAAARLGRHTVRAARHRLEHVEMVSGDQVRRLAGLGVAASVQPVFDAQWGHPGGLYETRVGSRAAAMNPWGDMAAAGVPLAFGSDSPVTPVEPWAAVRAAVHHHDPGQRLTPEAAFAAHTGGGWHAAGAEGGGAVEPGAPAYLCVWDAPAGTDLAAVVAAPEPPTCLLTLVAGVPAHDALTPRGGPR